MGKKLTDRVTWVGKVDWELKTFHGDELSTHRGSSYNSYLIRDKKNVLIDTSWLPYSREFVKNLKAEIDLKDIDYIVMCHNEIDHSGALVDLMREIPDTPIYCTAKGEAIIRGHYHMDWNFVNVKTGDKLELGDTTLTFIEATMLHWPDTMFCYLSNEEILFSNDGFGQHYATESLYDDQVCMAEVLQEAEKYYANIIAPFSPLCNRKVKEILGMNLPLKMICPSHGIIWRNNPSLIVEKYLQWSDNYQEDQVTIVYDTMWQSTRLMAQAIANGIREQSPTTTVKIYNAAQNDKNDILTEVFHSRAVLVGSPTINNGYSYAIAGILEMLKGMKLKKKKGAAFGSYGWSGEGIKLITEHLKAAGIETVNDGIRAQWVPDQDTLEQSRQFGKEFAAAL
ncbi:MAG: anaerobic nitric oxide reductase flavorubredoxin [Muribaculaceae bacterium]|nr:anaerobic nitric oxide reductase flavorubredoxin [Muribaculaceae bacterium]